MKGLLVQLLLEFASVAVDVVREHLKGSPKSSD